MSDIEVRLRTAMHKAVDGEEAAPEELITIVKRRHRRHLTRRAAVSVITALAIVVPMVIVLHGKISGSGSTSPHHHIAAASKLPSTLRGLPMPAGTNIEVLISTAHGAAWYSTITHKTRRIRGLPALPANQQGHGPITYQFRRINGGWAAFPTSVYSACDNSVCAGRPASYYFIAEGSLTATRIGAGYATDGFGVAPGIQPGTVWLVTYPRTTSSLSGSSFAQLVSSAGRPLGPRYQLPGNVLLSGGVGNYLLLSSPDGVSFELWNRGTRHVIRHFDNVLAHGPEQIVWSRGCAPCQLRVTNVTSGRTVTTPLRGQLNSLNATLTDDGRLLAAQLPDGEVAVVNTVTGSLTRIPGTALRAGNFVSFGWQNGGHRLVIAAGPISAPGPDQLAYWQPGDAHLYVATTRNPGEMEQITTGKF